MHLDAVFNRQETRTAQKDVGRIGHKAGRESQA